MIFKDYYMILGLNTNKVSTAEIKNAFREQAKKYHPDVNKENKYAEERFKDINEAYKILSGSNTKRKYDRIWTSRIAKKRTKTKKKENVSTINEILNMFFGTEKEIVSKKENNKNKIIQGENIETEINIKLEEGYFGIEKKISLRAVNGKMKSFSIKIPAGIRNGEKIRLAGQGKKRKKWWKKRRLIYKNKYRKQ